MIRNDPDQVLARLEAELLRLSDRKQTQPCLPCPPFPFDARSLRQGYKFIALKIGQLQSRTPACQKDETNLQYSLSVVEQLINHFIDTLRVNQPHSSAPKEMVISGTLAKLTAQLNEYQGYEGRLLANVEQLTHELSQTTDRHNRQTVEKKLSMAQTRLQRCRAAIVNTKQQMERK